MPIDILMPALSPTMEKGNLTRWVKKEGDRIQPGDVLAEIETDKATMEVEATDEGVLAKILVPDGSTDVPVHQRIGLIASEGEDPKAIVIGAQPASPPPSPAANGMTPPAPQSTMPPSANGQAGARLFASPLARRLAKEKGLDLTTITGSGPHGRIVKCDIEAALAKAPAPTPETKAPIPPTPTSDDAIKRNFAPGSFDEIPHDLMRKTIARRLVEASRTIPHFTLTIDCELDALLELRKSINAAAPRNKEGLPAYKISVNDFLIKALGLALIRVPDANVSWTETAMLRHKAANVGVAVAIQGGLITPIIRAAETKTLSQISAEMKDFAVRAKARKLRPEEYEGGASAISNLGMYGIKNFSAIINPPQTTILAVGAGEQRVIVRNGVSAIATLMSATLSCDHRAVDGVLGAKLLAAFKDLIEQPAGMLA